MVHDASRPIISCVVPAYNEAGGIADFLTELSRVLADSVDRHEILLIDDGSRDDTAQRAAALLERLPLRIIRFSRNFGKEAAISAGLDNARGDAVLVMDADYQHPFSLIPEFIRHWRDGVDMVYGVRESRHGDTFLKHLFSRVFYSGMARFGSIQIPPNAGDFRLMDRKVVDAICALPERSRFMKGVYAWVGFKTLGVPFAIEERRHGQSRFSFRRLSSLAIVGITSFSNAPLRLWSVLGATISGLSILYAFWVVLKVWLYGVDVPGWSTLTVGIMFLGGMQLLSIGILGEYISHIFDEVKQRPRYIVAERAGFDDADDNADSPE